MAKKKKTNPNKIPLAKEISSKEISEKVVRGTVFRVWLDILAAVASIPNTDQAYMVNFWERVDGFASTVYHHRDVARILDDIERITAVRLPFDPIHIKRLHTQGDIRKVEKKAEQNALTSAFALVAEPIIYEHLFDDDLTKRILLKAFSYDDEISSGQLRPEDIQEMLVDEYDLLLELDDGQTQLSILKPICNRSSDSGNLSVES